MGGWRATQRRKRVNKGTFYATLLIWPSPIDLGREHLENLGIQHGPQANYPAFAMNKEDGHDQLVDAVDRPSLLGFLRSTFAVNGN